ncbi:hypothetical protein F2Q69_00023793 [Brassica cretica]|uniref:SNRNP25 ubiquitin-like domain-containing protein n=1 Tax=Brassica cretica TaxID=69181 RepID=A0A8S9QDG6_BRACR|nr:hypothetical protein F2Q69_00023793 [Brassica cretica]
MRWSKQTWVIATFLGKALTFFIFSEKRSLCYYKSFVCRSPEQVSGSGKTLEEEEASSLSLTQQDLLDSSGRFPVIKVLVICNGEKMGLPLGLLTMETKREKRWSLLSQLLADPILADVPRNPTLSDVVTLVSLEKGSAMRLSIVKLDGSSLDVAVMNSATLKDLKIFDQEENRICSICDEEGSGKTLEEEEASSLSFTPQDLLDSSGRLWTKHSYVIQHLELKFEGSVVNHGVCDANSVVEGGRGEATEPSNNSDDRRNTSEVAPQKEVVSFGKRHRLD